MVSSRDCAVSSRDCAVSSVAYKISSRNRGGFGSCMHWSRVATGLASMVSGHDVCVMIMCGLESRLGVLDSQPVSRTAVSSRHVHGLESKSGVSTPSTCWFCTVYYPIEFWFHATIVYYPLNMFSCLVINQNGSNNQISNIHNTFISYSTSSSYIQVMFMLIIKLVHHILGFLALIMVITWTTIKTLKHTHLMVSIIT